jgi:hypothetical protein
MLSFLKKIFGVNATKSAPVPYKVDAPAKPSEFPFPSTKPVAAPKAEKKPAGKKPAARKPRKPQAPKA